jgi:hypothetical protein
LNLALAPQPPRTDLTPLERAILEALAYSDVFDYPLRLEELHRYLAVSASMKELKACINEFDQVGSMYGYYFLTGRSQIVSVRMRREHISRRAFERALQYGHLLGMLPFIRMVALTGSLAMRNCDETGDYDYMLVTKTGRVWLARAFALLLNRIARLFGETICPNLIISEKALQWTTRNLYTARELCQMVLIRGGDTIMNVRIANLWLIDYFPNYCCDRIRSDQKANKLFIAIRWFLEFLFGSKLGDILESWEMNRKITRFTQQDGFGMETKFNADICQGNFDHHGSRTMGKYHQRLQQLDLDFDSSRAHKGMVL